MIIVATSQLRWVTRALLAQVSINTMRRSRTLGRRRSCYAIWRRAIRGAMTSTLPGRSLSWVTMHRPLGVTRRVRRGIFRRWQSAGDFLNRIRRRLARDYAITLNNLGSLYWKVGRLADGERLLRECVTPASPLGAREPCGVRRNVQFVVGTVERRCTESLGKMRSPSNIYARAFR